VKISIAVLVLTQALNLVFVPWLAHAGLALSIGVAALVNATWLLVGLRRSGAYRPLAGWGVFLLRVVAATAVMAAWLVWADRQFDWVALQARWALRVGLLAGVLAGAALLYFGVLHLAGLRLRGFVKRG